MNRKLADTIVLDFTVHLPTTGAVSDADALPTVEIWEDETDTTLAGGTVTKRVGKTGNYRVAVVATTGNGFEVGKSYNVVVTVVAGGVTAKAVIGSFFIDNKRLADLNDIPAGTVMGKSPATLAAADVSGNLPAVVKAQDNIDFGALQKASLNAATPASVQNIPSTGSGFTALGDARIANLDAAVSTRAPEAAGNVAAIKTKTDYLPSASYLDAAITSRSTLTAQQVWEYATRTLSSFGTLVADIATAVWGAGTRVLTSFGSLVADTAIAVWGAGTRALTDKAGFTISGTKTTLDALNDLSQAGAQAGATAALNAYDPPTRAEATSDKAEIAALTALVIKALTNRLVVDPATGAYTIYADDGITPLITGTISGTGRSAPTWP